MMSEVATRYYELHRINAALATELEATFPNHRGWSCVVRFYGVLHLINAYLVDKTSLHFNPESTEHKERTRAMSKCPELRDVPEKYRNLKNLSESVRYDLNYQFTDEHCAKSIAWLVKIVAIVEPKLKNL